nr:unnamed protein product [Digitaria exilis]
MRVVGPWGIWMVLRLLDWILGPSRRSSGHWFVQYGAMAAYYLPTPLLLYAAKAVASLRSPLLIFWFSLHNIVLLTVSSTFLFQGAVARCTLLDSPLQLWRILPWAHGCPTCYGYYWEYTTAGASTCDDDDLLKKSHEVATALSRYCAYLVAFHPELLPEHSLNTITLLQQVLKEAKDLLGSTRSSMEKNDKIQGLQLPGDEGDSSLNTFQKGIKLGRRLADMLNSVRWKVMAEFWAETVLYVAPSDDVDSSAARIECLTKGGEFVTHIWAMLSNAGILKRATEEWSPRQSEPDS